MASEFNWNDSEIEEIKLEAMGELEKEMHRDYPDVNFPMEEAEQLIDATIDEIM